MGRKESLSTGQKPWESSLMPMWIRSWSCGSRCSPRQRGFHEILEVLMNTPVASFVNMASAGRRTNSRNIDPWCLAHQFAYFQAIYRKYSTSSHTSSSTLNHSPSHHSPSLYSSFPKTECPVTANPNSPDHTCFHLLATKTHTNSSPTSIVSPFHPPPAVVVNNAKGSQEPESLQLFIRLGCTSAAASTIVISRRQGSCDLSPKSCRRRG